MGAQKGQKQITLWVDETERDALQMLCKTNGISASFFLRSIVTKALEEQSVAFIPTPVSEQAKSDSAGWAKDSERVRLLEKRLASLEKAMPTFDQDALKEMHSELLEGGFGSVRYRLGIVEAQLQSLGGTIAWADTESEPALTNTDK